MGVHSVRSAVGARVPMSLPPDLAAGLPARRRRRERLAWLRGLAFFAFGALASISIHHAFEAEGALAALPAAPLLAMALAVAIGPPRLYRHLRALGRHARIRWRLLRAGPLRPIAAATGRHVHVRGRVLGLEPITIAPDRPVAGRFVAGKLAAGRLAIADDTGVAYLDPDVVCAVATPCSLHVLDRLELTPGTTVDVVGRCTATDPHTAHGTTAHLTGCALLSWSR